MINLKNKLKYKTDPLFKAAVDSYAQGFDTMVIMLESNPCA